MQKAFAVLIPAFDQTSTWMPTTENPRKPGKFLRGPRCVT